MGEYLELSEVGVDDVTSAAYEMLISVRVENMQGKLYTEPSSASAEEREALQILVCAGLVHVVSATAHSTIGYVAIPANQSAVVGVNGPGGRGLKW